MRTLLVIVLSPALVVAVLAVVGAIWQRVAESRDRRAYPPPGRVAEVGGRRIHYVDQGSGSPTVLLLAHAGGTGLYWEAVAAEVAEHTRVVLYDRPGLGFSDPDPEIPTASGAARTLHELTRAAGIPGPFVVVGWSIGGIHARAFAHLFPGETVGMVLVDASHHETPDRLPSRGPERLVADAYRSGARIGGLGVARIFGGIHHRSAGWVCVGTPHLSPRSDRVIRSRYRSRAGLRGLAHDNSHVDAAMAEIAEMARTHPPLDLPLVVIARGVPDPGENPTEATWRELQEELAGLSPCGRLVVADRSRHAIPLDQPELVAETVRQVVDEARAARRPARP